MENLELKYKLLIVSYLSNQATENEKKTLLEWLKASDENNKLFSEYKKIFELSLIANYKSKFSKGRSEDWKLLQNKIDFEKNENHQKARKFTFYLKIAAAVLVIFFAGVSIHWFLGTKSYPSMSNVEYEVVAPLGGKSEIVLTDGTKVWLNAGTRMRYRADYGISSRNVSLEGEGYFLVVKNPQKPFIVMTSGYKIKAFGTSFNVKAYPEEKSVTTTLVEGIVKIEGKGVNVSLKPKQVVIVNKEVTKLASNDKKPVTDNSVKTKISQLISEDQKDTSINDVTIATNVNTNIYTSWKDNLWIIESEPLKNIAVIIERKFNVTIDIKSPELNPYTFTGKFNNETLEQILDIFKLTAPLNYTINKGVVTIREEQKRRATYNNLINNQMSN